MVRKFILAVSVFSFVMFSFVSLAYCYDAGNYSSANTKISYDITDLKQPVDKNILDNYMDCHSSGSCHIGAHVISANLDEIYFLNTEFKYLFNITISVPIKRQYPPFQPPIA